MSESGISLNTAEFRQAMKDYLSVTKKDAATAMNRTLNNFLIKGVAESKVARAETIKAIEKETWWPKLVAKAIGRQAGAQAASKAFQAQWVKGEQHKHRKGAWKLDKEEQSYNRLARAMSRRFIGSRLRAVRFMSFFFATSSQRLAGSVQVGKKASAGKQFAGFSVTVRPAQPSTQCAASVDTVYKYKKRSNSEGINAKLREAINKAIPATIRDMREYIERKLAERAKQYSGRPA